MKKLLSFVLFFLVTHIASAYTADELKAIANQQQSGYDRIQNVCWFKCEVPANVVLQMEWFDQSTNTWKVYNSTGPGYVSREFGANFLKYNISPAVIGRIIVRFKATDPTAATSP
jgi:hypothetical protein